MVMHFSKVSNFYVHVKWFTESFEWDPLPFSRIVTPSFLFWLGFTVLMLWLVCAVSGPIGRARPILRIHAWLCRMKQHTQLILRTGLGIGLLLQLFSGSYLAPEFTIKSMWIVLGLFTAAACLANTKTLKVSGAILFLLYVQASLEYGVFHALDYLVYVGIVYCLFVNGTPLMRTAPAVLYLCMGFSLSWLAMEKLTMPALACSVMGSYGLPTFGFTLEQFVLISAFVEIGLAWAFMMGIMNRFTALLVTGIFFMTSLVFGHKEVIGHTIIHTLLILFVIEGTGGLRTPVDLHRKPMLRSLFVTVNFCLFLFILMPLYIWMGKAM